MYVFIHNISIIQLVMSINDIDQTIHKTVITPEFRSGHITTQQRL